MLSRRRWSCATARAAARPGRASMRRNIGERKGGSGGVQRVVCERAVAVTCRPLRVSRAVSAPSRQREHQCVESVAEAVSFFYSCAFQSCHQQKTRARCLRTSPCCDVALSTRPTGTTTRAPAAALFFCQSTQTQKHTPWPPHPCPKPTSPCSCCST
jgi:hypothetical protein